MVKGITKYKVKAVIEYLRNGGNLRGAKVIEHRFIAPYAPYVEVQIIKGALHSVFCYEEER